jgi:hypothetical protein
METTKQNGAIGRKDPTGLKLGEQEDMPKHQHCPIYIIN